MQVSKPLRLLNNILTGPFSEHFKYPSQLVSLNNYILIGDESNMG